MCLKLSRLKFEADCYLPAPSATSPPPQTTSFGALLDVVLDILLRGWLWVNALPASVALLLPLLEMMVFAVTHKVRKGPGPLASALAFLHILYISYQVVLTPCKCFTQGQQRFGLLRKCLGQDTG